MAITQLECFRATMAHEPHEGFLLRAGFTPDMDKKMREALKLGPDEGIMGALGVASEAGVGMRAPQGGQRPDYSVYYEGVEMPEGSYIDGNGVLHTPGSLHHFTHYVSPLRNATKFEDIESYPFPSNESHTSEGMAGSVESAHANGRPVTSWVGHMYENSWQVRGYEEFLIDMIDRPEWCEHILDRYKENNIRAATAAARAGADCLRTGDDVANQNALMFSPPQWRRFIKSRWAEVYAAARAIKPDIEIWYHSDGNIEAVIPELIEIGVTILNPVQPECMDLEKINAQWGDKLVFDGTIGTQSTMPWGTPEDVKAVVRERARTLGADGGLIVAPTHVLEPEVPVENVLALVEAVKEFGKVV